MPPRSICCSGSQPRSVSSPETIPLASWSPPGQEHVRGCRQRGGTGADRPPTVLRGFTNRVCLRRELQVLAEAGPGVDQVQVLVDRVGDVDQDPSGEVLAEGSWPRAGCPGCSWSPATAITACAMPSHRCCPVPAGSAGRITPTSGLCRPGGGGCWWRPCERRKGRHNPACLIARHHIRRLPSTWRRTLSAAGPFARSEPMITKA
jgi:hypothetical protein